MLIRLPEIREFDLQFALYHIKTNKVEIQVWDDGDVVFEPTESHGSIVVPFKDMQKITAQINKWLKLRRKWMKEHANDSEINM